MTKSPAAQNALSEAEEIEALLPWLVTDTLAPAEQARVLRYLETHPQIAAYATLARDERQATIAANETIAVPGTAALDRLMASIAVTPQPSVANIPSPASVWAAIAGFIAGLSPRALGLATAAAALVLVVQAATIAVLATRDTGAAYDVASGPQATASTNFQVLVVLRPDATVASLNAALGELKASIVEGPKAGGLYRLQLSGQGTDHDAMRARVRARTDIFASVLPVAR